MRLLNTRTLTVEEFGGNQVPPYAILSHRWEAEEVTLQDIMTDKAKQLMGYGKVKMACSIAVADHFDYIWIDTCCIDKTSSAELSETLNSMYRWYEEAEECYAYLADVPRGIVNHPTGAANDKFRESKWFTRGWTLQELIAPLTVVFLNSKWQKIGSKSSLQSLISEITGIPGGFLLGDDIEHASIAQRMSWASKRETTRVEDIAYCLMGIFGIHMPMLYGEGIRAFIRLQEEIMRFSDDHSLFAWRSMEDHGGIFATSPAAFANSGNIIQINFPNAISSPPTLSSRGIRLSLPFKNNNQQGSGLAILHCTEIGKENMRLAIHLRDVFLTNENFTRERSSSLKLLPLEEITPSQYPVTDLYVKHWRSTRNRKWRDIEMCVVKLEGVGEEVVFRTIYLHSNWKLHQGLIVTATELPLNGILGLLLVICKDGNSFQIILRKHGSILSADIHTRVNADSGQDQRSTIPEQQQREHDQIVRTFGDGQNVHVAIKKQILTLDGKEKPTGVVEISYSTNILGQWLEHIAVLEGDNKGRTLLSCEAGEGHARVVSLLLDTNKVDINLKDTNGLTPLARAAENGHEIVVGLLLQEGAEKGTRDCDGRTPLSRAAENGHEAVVQLLLSKSTKNETKDKNSQMRLSRAIRYMNMLRFDKQIGKDTKDQDSQTPLLNAAKEIEWKDRLNRTPLSWAATGGHEAVVKLLLNQGAEVESKDKDGRTPLSRAATNGHEAVVKLLLKQGAEVESKDRHGERPLSWAAMNGHETVVKLLLEQGAKVESKDKYGQTPLSWAAKKGHVAVVKLLLDQGAKVEPKDEDGLTPLFRAATNGHEAIVRLLLDQGAEVESKDKDDRTPLSWAAMNGHEAVVRQLLVQGAEVESKDKDGRTPLSWAAMNGNKIVVKLLLEQGAEIESKDEQGETPLSWAAKNGHRAIAKLGSTEYKA